MQKKCSKCSKDQPLGEFYLKKNGKRRSHCKDCIAKYAADKYKSSYAGSKQRQETRLRNRNNNRRQFFLYLIKHPCIDCGETDPVVLECDHVNPASKERSVSYLVQSGYSFTKRILPELEKCVVRCQNCHRRKTAKEQGWFERKSNGSF